MEVSRRWSFIVVIVGILVLLLVMVFGGEKRVESLEEVEELEINSKVILRGIVLSERKFGEGKMLEMDNGIEVLCDSCSLGFEGKKIEVKGKIYNVYENKKVLALRMVVLENEKD
jgi:hypothetical protein